MIPTLVRQRERESVGLGGVGEVFIIIIIIIILLLLLFLQFPPSNISNNHEFNIHSLTRVVIAIIARFPGVKLLLFFLTQIIIIPILSGGGERGTIK